MKSKSDKKTSPAGPERVRKLGIFPLNILQPDLQLNTKYAVQSPILCPPSPSELNLVLAISQPSYHYLKEELTSMVDGTMMPDGWNVGKMDVLAVHYHHTWYRGVATKKKGRQFTIYLVDKGTSCVAQLEDLRPLPEKLREYPVCAIQVKVLDFNQISFFD